MLLSCPKCGKEIDSANINIAKDIAFCASCGEVYNISKLTVESTVESTPQEQPTDTAAAPTEQAPTPPHVEAAEEKTELNVILKAYDEDKKISVIKEVREIFDLGLKEARDIVEGAPKLLKKGVSKKEAAQIRYRINTAGGIVEIQSTGAAVPRAKAGLCAKCGAQIKEGLKFCTKCGTPIGAVAASTAQAVSVEPPKTVPLCAKCGAQIKEGLKFCTKCGAPVGVAAVSTAQAVPTEPLQTEPLFVQSSNKGIFVKQVFGFYDGNKVTLVFYLDIKKDKNLLSKDHKNNFMLYVDAQLIAEGNHSLNFFAKKRTVIETQYKFSSGVKLIQCFFKEGSPNCFLNIFVNEEYIGGDQF